MVEVFALEVTLALAVAEAARDRSPSDARSPATSTSALFFTLATATEVTGMAVEESGCFLPMAAALTFTSAVASACRLASPPALMEPVLPTVTEAVFVLSAQSASQLNPSCAAKFCPISETFFPSQVVLSNTVLASADTSTPPSDSILPATSTVALFVVFTIAL